MLSQSTVPIKVKVVMTVASKVAEIKMPHNYLFTTAPRSRFLSHRNEYGPFFKHMVLRLMLQHLDHVGCGVKVVLVFSDMRHKTFS